MHSPRRLLSVLGVTFGLAVTIGNVIGAGILRTPGTIAEQLPSFWPFLAVWVIGALYAFLGANALAELATTVPRSGGQYVFVRHALGDYAGFVVGWSDWISTCGTTAAVSIVLGEYATVLFPSLRSTEVVGLVVIAVLTLVQWFGVRAGALAQDLTSAMKALVLLMLVAVCFVAGSRNPAAPGIEAIREGSMLLAFVIALQAVIYTYDGWSAVIYFSEEVRNPARDIPRAMFGGLIGVTILYLLINIAFVRVVPLATIAGESLAASTVAKFLFGPNGGALVRAIMVVALISAVNSNVLMAPRVVYAMATDRLFWRGAREVNKGGTPDVALLLSSMLAAVFIVSGTFEAVVAKLAFFFVAQYILSFVSLFVLRRREPAANRGWRAVAHPWSTGLAIAASAAFLVAAMISDPVNSAWALGILAATVPAYLILRAIRVRSAHAEDPEIPMKSE